MTSRSVPIEHIIVSASRVRKSLAIDDLKSSIARIGLLHPIVVKEDPSNPGSFILMAGERRLSACKELGHSFIDITIFSKLDPALQEIVELEENLKRRNITWQEMAKEIARIDRLFHVTNAGWSIAKTAKELSVSEFVIRSNCTVASQLDDEKVYNKSSITEALNFIERKRDRKEAFDLSEVYSLAEGTAETVLGGREIAEVAGKSEETPGTKTATVLPSPVAVAPVSSTVLCENFLLWAPKFTGKRFNLLHCDFPYGIDNFAGPMIGDAEEFHYDDKKIILEELLDTLIRNIDKLLSPSAHLIFWYSEKTKELVLKYLTDPRLGFTFYSFPLIWHKSDNVGVASNPKRFPRHTYETALFGTRMNRSLVGVKADSFSCPTDKRLHPSCKPGVMMRHFLSMVVDDSTRLLDPTCGSGSAVNVAQSLGAEYALGLEIDYQIASNALKALTTPLSLDDSTIASGNLE